MTQQNDIPVLQKQFADHQLQRILEQAAIYACACPAQVCKAIFQQRSLFIYQAKCLNNTATDVAVHQAIVDAVHRTHAELEECLKQVLELEGWDLETLSMPATLMKRLADSINDPE